MKLIALSGGAGAEIARSSCAENGILPTERVVSAIGKKEAKVLARELIAAQPELVLCFGETGLAAGLFVLPKLRRAKIPLVAVADAQISLPEGIARLDAILCTDPAARGRLLQMPIRASKLRLLSDGAAALFAPCRKKRGDVVISGSYGLSNLGDEAMLTAILAQIRRVDPQTAVTVLSRSPAETRSAHCVDAVSSFAIVQLWRRLRRAKLLISGGGTLLTDLTSTRSLLYYQAIIRLAHLAGAKVLLYSCGIGPFFAEKNKKRTAHTLNRCADAIVVRDSRSAEELAAIGVTKPQIICGADAAFSLTPQVLSPAELPPTLAALGTYAIFALRPWDADEKTIAVVRETARRLWEEHGLASVFLGMEPPKDLPIARNVAEGLTTPHLVLEDVATFTEAFAAISCAAVVVSMRLHAMIVAGVAGVPVVGISYDIKISGYLEYAGSPDCVDYSELTSDALLAQIAHALESGRTYLPAHINDGEAILQTMLAD